MPLRPSDIKQQLPLFGVRAKIRDDNTQGAEMARNTAVAMQHPIEDPTEFAEIVARSMPNTINADMVLTGMAKRALDKGMMKATSFDEALLAVFKEGIRLGREDAPKRGVGRPRGSGNKSNGAALGEAQQGARGPGSALGSAQGIVISDE